ncbi:PH domain-containing protein [Nocardioides sp. MAHUQ-72]|uniref:PH domain-containing protein n=1 Tax=unclassified Nocardioides TaxID=2615069 RepID=UPI00360B60EF
MSELTRDRRWQRLDARMLLVHPARELLRFLPVLVGLLVAGNATGGSDLPWQLLGIAVPIGLGVLRYVTTSFRITPGRVELRRGLLNRHLLSAPLDRVRTVDLTSSPIHRLLGLTTVRIGTGTASSDDEDRLDLDGLPLARARRLREDLLHLAPATGGPEPATADRLVVSFDPSWIRFAPLTSAGLVLAAGVLGAAAQGMNTFGLWDRLDSGALLDDTAALSWWTLVPVGVVAIAVVVSALSVAGYLIANWGLTLSHAQGVWHLRRGLLTTRETSLDDERVAGVSIHEPLPLRLAGGGRASAIVTGLDRRQAGSSLLVPAAPRPVVLGVAREVLGSAGPVDAPLAGHGPQARRRRFTRALGPAAGLVLLVLLLVLLADAPAWLLVPALLAVPVALVLAVDRARSLGHALVAGHLVARSGSLDRRRHALDTRDVIGWTFRSTFFQRRAGLSTLVATTAGGQQAVTLPDVPEPVAVDLAAAAVPGLLGQFTA